MSPFHPSQLDACAPHLLDQPFYRHSRFDSRPAWRPAGTARVACLIYLYLEHFEVSPPEDALFDRRFLAGLAPRPPYLRANAFFEYGNRVGIFRALDLLDELGLSATVPANAAALAAYPALVDELQARGYEFLAHGDHASRIISSQMPVAAQRAVVRGAIAAIEAATGARPRGWMSQDYGQSPDLPFLLAEAGLEYLCDYSNDEHPYRLTLPLVSVPNCAEWSDVEMMLHRRLPTGVYAQAVIDAFDGLRADGAQSTRVFALHIHPWISCQPARFRGVERILRHIAAVSGIWHTTAGAVADAAAI